jgi:hypothetical protein
MSSLFTPKEWMQQVAIEQILEIREIGCFVAGTKTIASNDDPPSECHGYCSDEECDAIHPDHEETLGEALLSAAVHNNSFKIRELIEEKGVSADYANPANQTVLHIAALWGNGRFTYIIVQYE